MPARRAAAQLVRYVFCAERLPPKHLLTARFLRLLQEPVKEVELAELRLKKPGLHMPKAQKAGHAADVDEREYTLMKNDFRSSTKLNALVKHLDRLSKEQPNFKALVFSHFTVRLAFFTRLRLPN